MSESIGIVYHDTETMSRLEFAQFVEELGYESVWVSEGWGESAVATLAAFASQTNSITLGSAIINVFSRTPAVLAMTAATLDRISEDRFVLGLGASHPKYVEELHGLSYDRPITRVRETIDVVSRLLASDTDPVEYSGDLVSTSGHRPLDCDVPIFNAALGPANRRVTGELCDGWMPNQIPISRLESDFEVVAEGARAVGRSPDEITVQPWVPAIVHEDEQVAKDMMRRAVAGYAGRYSAYHDTIAASHPDVAAQIVDAWSEDDREGAANAVTDEVVQQIGITGTPVQAREQLADILAIQVIDTPILTVPAWVDSSVVEQTVTELAPSTLS